jgi:hypothetical protein
MGDLTGPAADAATTAATGLPAPSVSAHPGALDRYTALVAALLGVRTDYASARFDAEVAAALAANRLDVATARTLRWWQRASVREVEGYAGSVLPAVLATRSDADTVAAIDSDEVAASWQRAQAQAPATTPLTVPATAPDTVVLPDLAAPAAAVRVAPAESRLPTRVITIPDPSTRRRSASEIQQAVRAALRATALPLDAGPPFDAPAPQGASSARRDGGDHAHTAPTA